MSRHSLSKSIATPCRSRWPHERGVQLFEGRSSDISRLFWHTHWSFGVPVTSCLCPVPVNGWVRSLVELLGCFAGIIFVTKDQKLHQCVVRPTVREERAVLSIVCERADESKVPMAIPCRCLLQVRMFIILSTERHL